LESVRAHTPSPYEVILADNGSTPAVRRYLIELQADWPELGVIPGPNDGVLSYAENFNRGLRMAHGNFLTVPGIQNDMELTAGCLAEMIMFIQADRDLGMGVFGVFRPDGSLESYGGHVRLGESNCGPANMEADAECDYGGVALITRRCFEAVGMMDERFPEVYFHDTDYGWRVRRAGFKVQAHGACRIIHHHDETDRIGYCGPANEVLFRAKWGAA
jgi:GT2 family glycosyltransferase